MAKNNSLNLLVVNCQFLFIVSSTAESKDVSFLSNCFDFEVPEPTPEDDVIEHWWVNNLTADNQTNVALSWKGEIISESGLRQCNGLSWVNMGDLGSTEAKETPLLPLQCYIDASYRVEHNFNSGPARVQCHIIIENTTEHTNVDAVLSFQNMLDSVAGLGDCSFIWSGLSEKKIKLV